MAIPLADVAQWIGYLLYLLGFLALWVYNRDRRNDSSRIAELEKTRPTRDDVNTMIEAAFYRDSTRP